ncbi:hypothetical protein C1H46_038739 [Malus baccata]|uniref:Signal recognition particle receptor subunit beta n=1 Tax=Malus baccata TaxID=106549 RepID=A0A540KNA7_MALBA|nr:hypothetical protein C1H46_038739 [Malus baccata]
MEGLELLKELAEQWKKQAEQWSSHALQYFHQVLPEQIYAAIVVLLFTSILLLLGCLNAQKLISRHSGSGKTVLFYQLRDGSSHQGTVTSMEPNDGYFVLHSENSKGGKENSVHPIDVPGHSHLRAQLDDFLPQAAGIDLWLMLWSSYLIVVLLLSEISSFQYKSYNMILKNGYSATVVRKKIPVLILYNKTDKVTAHIKEFIRKQLEKEIEKLRASRSAISAADIANDFTLGVPGEVFSFSHRQNKVTVAEASGLTGEISRVEQFVREHVKS